MKTVISSYWKIYRLIFVLFFLYLIGDAFYRWDGFSFYATLSEFLPSVAFVSILFCISAVITSILVWLPLKAFEWSCQRMGWKINTENLLIFFFCFVLLGTIVLFSKRLLFGGGSTLQQKMTVLLCVIFVSSLLTWILRGKLNSLIEGITPLVWLFSIIIICSVPLVVYHIWADELDTDFQKYSHVSETDKNRQNIILVTFDALTARDMSAYGYRRPTTPFISKWSESASLFTRAEAESNITGPSTASLMTGKRSWTHQVYHMPEHSKPVKSGIENLAFKLKQNNYCTIADVSNPAATPEVLGISQSFDIIRYFHEGPYYKEWLYKLTRGKIRLYDWILQGRLTPGLILKYIISHRYIKNLFWKMPVVKIDSTLLFNWFLSQNNFPEPYFAWIHLMPPHDPYSPPEPYLGMFEAQPPKGRFNQFAAKEKINAVVRDHQRFTQEVQPLIYKLRALYDEYIRYCDKEFEEFIAALEQKDQLKNTVVILSSDHGESFEHNYLLHGKKYLYEQVTHIPLIIKEPGQTKGKVINTPVAHVDIPATILDLADLSVPPWMDGRSLVPFIRGEDIPPPPVFSMNYQKNRSLGHPITKGTIAVWDGDYKLIHYLSSKKSLLFNLKQDPDELNNLYNKEPEVGQRLLTLIHDNLQRANEKISIRE